MFTSALPSTEQRNSRSLQLDQLSTAELVRLMQEEDRAVLAAMESQCDAIAAAIGVIVLALERGGRLFYLGAGTSGRLGVLDASEAPPTFQSRPELIQGVIAGGDHALRFAVEGAEDDAAQGVADLQARGFAAGDVLVGIGASGRTPYVLGGLRYAASLGARTIGVSCVEGSAIAAASEIAITPVVGPEVLTGSTRLKAGTATKLVLNQLSTGAMVRLGYVYENLMVNVAATNKKLEDRALRILMTLTDLPQDEAARLLAAAGSIKAGVVMHRLQLSRTQADQRLSVARGNLRRALA
ncbi:N-acetylmuramic acid 6-phosphate etherase [Granulicella cerasi]|uniref:N-acetylmuramic acid 6-phosphate etherase n=1 Tax=Granulicella cerasi TaxID=741063 RepID=A0ABW1Z8G8_9BACT|nr:N-acetylmuramic acid 6-phosphate etherase [Granulicella cerasi]